jgi:uncharacterized membrane protein
LKLVNTKSLSQNSCRHLFLWCGKPHGYIFHILRKKCFYRFHAIKTKMENRVFHTILFFIFFQTFVDKKQKNKNEKWWKDEKWWKSRFSSLFITFHHFSSLFITFHFFIIFYVLKNFSIYFEYFLWWKSRKTWRNVIFSTNDFLFFSNKINCS